MADIFQARDAGQYAVARTLFGEYAAQLGHDLCFQNFAAELEGLPQVYGSPGGALLLARAGPPANVWIGCVGVRGRGGTVCEMKRLYVRAEHRRTGTGRRLSEETIRVARSLGYERMRLDTLSDMEPARALYRSLGFREIPAYYDNPLPGVVYYELDLARA